MRSEETSGHSLLIGHDPAKAQQREFYLRTKRYPHCFKNPYPRFLLNRCLADYFSGDLDARLSCSAGDTCTFCLCFAGSRGAEVARSASATHWRPGILTECLQCHVECERTANLLRDHTIKRGHSDHSDPRRRFSEIQ
jgi:hypothetical protein